MSDEQHCKGGGHGHHPDISCREVSEFLLAYLERELDEGAREEFDRHLQMCPPCVHYLDGYRETVTLVRTCGRKELDPEQRRAARPPEDLIKAILTAKAQATGSSDT
jgi:anti-sigma factor (TIGR02949 family)